MNICYSDFCKICRLCLKYVDGLQSIFDEFAGNLNSQAEQMEYKLVDIINDYLGVEVQIIN